MLNAKEMSACILNSAVQEVSKKLSPRIKDNYTDFMQKYLRACLRLRRDEEKTRVIFSDTKRHFYFYGPPERIQDRLSKRVAKVTLEVFKKGKKNNKKNPAVKKQQESQEKEGKNGQN